MNIKTNFAAGRFGCKPDLFTRPAASFLEQIPMNETAGMTKIVLEKLELASRRLSYAKTIDTQAESVVRYLDHAAQNALEQSLNISPVVADVKAHPLPAWQDLIVTPVSKRTLVEVTNEITNYLREECEYFAPGMMNGLEDFIVWYHGTFLTALQQLTEKKIATAETLGKARAKDKLIHAFIALPSLPSQEAFEDYCQRISKQDGEDPTDEIVRQWREGKPSPLPSPEAFQTAFRNALKLDAEATAEINGDEQTAASCGYTAEDRKRDEETAEHARQAAAKNKRELEAKARGGRKCTRIRKEETATDPLKQTIRREVNKLKAEWDGRYPDRHKPGNKDHTDNQIYRMIAKKHHREDGTPIYSLNTIKGWYSDPRLKRNTSKKN